MITVNSTINLTNQAVPPIIPVVQGDTGRAIVFTLADFTIPAGATATYYVQKPSGEAVYNSAEVSGNTVTVELTAQSIIEVGENNLQVRIILDEAVVTSFDVILMVRPFRGIDAVQSETEMNIFDKAVEEAKEEIDAAAQEAEEYISQAIDDTLTIAGKAADAKAVGDALATGYYPDLYAGGLTTDDGDTDRTPYTFRATPYQSDREQMEIDGLTVAWNQLVQNGNFSDGTEGWGSTPNSTISATGGVCTLATTSTSNRTHAVLQAIGLTSGHKYLARTVLKNLMSASGTFGIKYNVSGAYQNAVSVTVAAGATTAIETVFSALIDATNVGVGIQANLGAQDVFSISKVNVIDLTTMFGSTIADYIYNLEQTTTGAGVTVVRQFLTKDYYPYCQATLKSVAGLVSHDTVGFNQWDEEWEVGSFNWQTGEPTSATTRIRSKNFIRVLPGKTYFIGCGNFSGSSAEDIVIAKYGYDKAYLGFVNVTYGVNQEQTIPSDCFYIKFATVQAYGATYKNDICISLSDPLKNGTYEPYVKHTYPLDSTLTLRGIMKLDGSTIYADGDVYAADGTVTRRYGVHVFTGTETLTMLSAQTEGWAVFAYNPSPACATTSYGVLDITDVGDVVSYPNFSSANLTRRIVTHYGDGIRFALPCTSVADARTDLTGKTLIYRLATPTTETADPYTTPQICAPGGTEEFVVEADADGAEVPVGHTTFYPVDLKGRLEGLPNDFSTLIAPTEVTYTATRNYTTGSLFIIKNILYKATANIANGGTITPGTNCTPTTLAEIISAL